MLCIQQEGLWGWFTGILGILGYKALHHCWAALPALTLCLDPAPPPQACLSCCAPLLRETPRRKVGDFSGFSCSLCSLQVTQHIARGLNMKYWSGLGAFILPGLSTAGMCRFYTGPLQVHCSAAIFHIMRKPRERNAVTSLQVCNLSLSHEELCLLTCPLPMTVLW